MELFVDKLLYISLKIYCNSQKINYNKTIKLCRKTSGSLPDVVFSLD